MESYNKSKLIVKDKKGVYEPSKMATQTNNVDLNPLFNKDAEISANSSKIDKFRTSFIEDHEEEEAKKIIEENLGFEIPPVCGYHMLVKIYVRPEDVHEFVNDRGEKKAIYLPAIATAGDKFRSCVGLVLAQGRECYSKQIARGEKPWCKVGDWVVIARNAGPQINYRGVPASIIPDDQIFMVVSDPTYVTRD